MTRMIRSMLLSLAAATLPIAAPASGQSPAPPAVDPNPPSENMRAVLNVYGAFERARDRCDREAMAEAVRRLDALALLMEEEEAEIEAELSTDGRPIAPGRSRRLDRARSEHGYTDAIAAQARRDPPRNCPEDEPPPSPPMPAPGRPGHGPAYYALLGLTYLDDGDTDLGFASLGGGYRFGDHFGIEGEAAIGLIDEENESGAFRDSFGIDFDLAAYATVHLPVGDNADLFARAGYGITQFSFSAVGPGFDFEESTGDGSFRYGLGGQIFFDEANGVRATWTRWDEFEEDGIDADVFVISYVRRFGGAG